MRKILFTAALFVFIAPVAFANITVEVTSLTNTSGNAALEACGTAVDSDGSKPLLVTVKHDLSYYSTMTDSEGRWCTLFKRWTYDGRIEVQAALLHDMQTSKAVSFSLKQNITN